jgi:hypothetical protein
MESSDGVPVETVRRPSMGDGRTPGTDWVSLAGGGDAGDGAGEGEDESAVELGSVRVSAMLRLRNAIGRVWWWGRLVFEKFGGCLSIMHGCVMELGG